MKFHLIARWFYSSRPSVASNSKNSVVQRCWCEFYRFILSRYVLGVDYISTGNPQLD